MNWLFVIFGLLVLWLIVSWFRKPQERPLPPGPPLLECLQIFKSCLKKFEIHLISEKLWRRYGELVLVNFLGKDIIFVNSVRLARKLFTSAQYKDYTNDRPPSFIRNAFSKGGKDVVFGDNCELQAKLRKMIHNVVRLYGTGIKVFEEMINSEVRILEDQITAGVGQRKYNLDKALTISLIRVIHVFLTNQHVEDQDKLCSVVQKYDRLLDLLLRFDNNLALMFFPFLQYIPNSRKTLVDDSFASLKQLLNMYLNEEKCKELKGNGSLIGTLIEEQDKDPQLTDQHVQGVVRNTVVAAFVTTKATLCGFFLMMMYYPEVQKKIQLELDEKIGRDRHPSLDDRPELHYTNAVILEVLRYIRHTPLAIPHMTTKDLEVEGYRIPSHSTVIMNIWVMNRDESIWTDPYSFKPERFLDEEGKFVPIDHRLRQQFMVFGIGRRNCVGESFAKSRVFLYVTSLLQKFNFKPGDNELSPENSELWLKKSALCPEFLDCVVENRK